MFHRLHAVRHKNAYNVYILQGIEAYKWRLKDDLHTSTLCLKSFFLRFIDDTTNVGAMHYVTQHLWWEHMNSDIYLVRLRLYSRRYLRPVV